MSTSTRFPVAIHILTILALHTDEYVSSELIAKSVGTHSVVVRRVLALLHAAGFVVTQPGALGGARLDVDPDAVTLLDVYEAVEDQRLFRLHGPHPKCRVACSVKDSLTVMFDKVENKMLQELGRTRLAKVAAAARGALRKQTH